MNQRTFRQLERIESQLRNLQCEIRFVSSIVEVKTPGPMVIDVEEFLVVMQQIVRQLRVTRGIAKRILEVNHTDSSPRAKG